LSARGIRGARAANMTFLIFSSAKRETRRSRVEVVHTMSDLLNPSTIWDNEMATPLSRPSIPGPGPSRTRKRVSRTLGKDTLKIARDRMVFLNRSNDLSRSHRSILPVSTSNQSKSSCGSLLVYTTLNSCSFLTFFTSICFNRPE
jgi:hypothetical protein